MLMDMKMNLMMTVRVDMFLLIRKILFMNFTTSPTTIRMSGMGMMKMMAIDIMSMKLIHIDTTLDLTTIVCLETAVGMTKITIIDITVDMTKTTHMDIMSLKLMIPIDIRLNLTTIVCLDIAVGMTKITIMDITVDLTKTTHMDTTTDLMMRTHLDIFTISMKIITTDITMNMMMKIHITMGSMKIMHAGIPTNVTKEMTMEMNLNGGRGLRTAIVLMS